MMCSEGDPNPDCDAYRPGTTYKGWKDQAYYDRQEQQRARSEQEAEVKYAQGQEEQKREAEKKKHECSWTPFEKNSCEAQAVGSALDAAGQCIGGPEHTCLKIGAEIAVGFAVGAACELATAGAGSIGCLMLAGAVSGAVGGALECKSGQDIGGCAGKGAITGAAFGVLGGAAGRVVAKLGARVISQALARGAGEDAGGVLSKGAQSEARFMNPVGAGRLPAFSQSEGTQGILNYGNGASIPLRSGMQGPSMAVRGQGLPGFNGNQLLHVEGHAAAYMRTNNLTSADLEINRIPCGAGIGGGCMGLLPRMLPEGAKLRVYGPEGYFREFLGLPD